MKGTAIIVTPEGRAIVQEVTTPIPLKFLNDGVGGSIELIPHLNSVMFDKQVRDCVAYVNAYGKGMSLRKNELANFLWDLALARQGISRFEIDLAYVQPTVSDKDHLVIYEKDHLVGSIVILLGDKDFMDGITK
jgi:hypothetical protein